MKAAGLGSTQPDSLEQAKRWANNAVGSDTGDYIGVDEPYAVLAQAYATIALVEELRAIRRSGLDVTTFRAEV